MPGAGKAGSELESFPHGESPDEGVFLLDEAGDLAKGRLRDFCPVDENLCLNIACVGRPSSKNVEEGCFATA